MQCSEVRPLLAARRDLPFGKEREVQLHLTTCSHCMETWRVEEEVLRALRAFPLPPSTAVARVTSRGASRPWDRAHVFGRAGRALSVATLALGAVLLALALGGLFHGASATLSGASPSTSGRPMVAAAGTAQPATAVTPTLSRNADDQLLDTLIANFALRLHTDPATLNAAFSAAASDTLDQAAKQGTLNAQDAAMLKKQVTGQGLRGVLQSATLGQSKPVDMPQAADAVLPAAATALGLAPNQLVEAIKGGKPLSTLATERHIDLQLVRTAMLDAAKHDLDTRVRASQLTQQQADEQLQAVTKYVEALLAGKTELINQQDPADAFNPKAIVIPVIVQALGITEDQLGQALNSGKSVGTLAQERHVDVQQLRTTMLNAGKTELDRQLHAGTLTQAQSTKLLMSLTEFVDALLNGKKP